MSFQYLRNLAVLTAGVLGFGPNTETVIAGQWLGEKGDKYWEDYPNVTEFNFGNVATTERIASPGAGIVLYCYTLLLGNPSAYAEFVAEGRANNASACIDALCASPWANPHYDANVLQSWIDTVYGANQPSNPSLSPSNSPNPATEEWATVTESPPNNTIWGMGQSRGIPVQQILRLNPGINPRDLQIGERVRVR